MVVIACYSRESKQKRDDTDDEIDKSIYNQIQKHFLEIAKDYHWDDFKYDSSILNKDNDYCGQMKRGDYIIQFCTDIDKSGKDTDRKQLQILLNLVNFNMVSEFRVKNDNRLIRNAQEATELIKQFARHKTKLILYENPTILESKQLFDMTVMLSAFQIDISRKAQQSLLKTLVELKRPHQPPPIGYLMKDGNFILDEKNAPAVLEAFELFWEKGRPRHKNDLKLLAEMVTFYKDGKKVHLTKDYIRDMLRNKVYMGLLTARFYDEWHIPKETKQYEGSYPPIVSKELFENVQKKLAMSPIGKN